MGLETSDLHNFGLGMLNDLIGWTDVILVVDIESSSWDSSTKVTTPFTIKALISSNVDAYAKDITNTKEFKLCKIPMATLAALTGVPVYPDSLKKKNAKIRTSDTGDDFQITKESTGSFNGRDWFILSIERDS
jgi:hypothetical protein